MLTAVQTLAYGPAPDQVGDWYQPKLSGGGIVCLIHGGFWRMPWARDHIAPIARDLAAHGFAVWSLEYRRVGQEGGGWPGTGHDIAAGIEHLAAMVSGDSRPIPVTVIGHSAGGQLALWAASRAAADAGRVRIVAVAALAAVADLRHAFALDCGRGAVGQFLGGSPDQVAAHYRAASPAELLPLGVPQLVLHATGDADVPVEIARCYSAAAQAAGDAVTYVELANASHMDSADPGSAAHRVLRDWLLARRGAAPPTT